MTELSKHEKSFIKKLETMKKDVKRLNRQDATGKIDKLIKMINDGCSEDDAERSRVMDEAFELYTEAMSDKLEQLVQKNKPE